MLQLEIPFFYPLTEQISLDLDFTLTEQWITEWRKRQLANSVTSTNGYNIGAGVTGGVITWSQPVTSSFVIKPTEKNVGKWEITHSMFVYTPTKPNAIIRFMAKHLLGFKWHNEI